MAKGKREVKTDYAQLIKQLREGGAERLYTLYGKEDYLKESFFEEIKKACEIDEKGFNYHRFDGANIELDTIRSTVDSMPFMAERSFIEIRGFEINSFKEERAEGLKSLLSDLPDYVCLCFILPTGYEPDGRLTAVKTVKKLGNAIEFTSQPQALLIKWIQRRFMSMGKSIGAKECERLIFVSGEYMTGLISEIDKIGSYAMGDSVSIADIDAVARRLPEASVFEMTDRLSEKRFDEAGLLLAELLQSGEHPIMILAMIGMQLRRLYYARLSLDEGKGRDFFMQSFNISYSFIADKLLSGAKRFSTETLRSSLILCCEADYKMKSSSENDEDILKDLILKIAFEGKR